MVNTKNVHEMLDGKYISHEAIGRQEWLYRTWKAQGLFVGQILVYRVWWENEKSLKAEYLAQSRTVYESRRYDSQIVCDKGHVEVVFD